MIFNLESGINLCVSATLPAREFSIGTIATLAELFLTFSKISSNVLHGIDVELGYKFLPANSL